MKWVTFFGYARSGHTVVSAILDAHPHCRISEELRSVSKWKKLHRTKEEVFGPILASGMGKERSKYKQPGMLTHVEPLMVIGDKYGMDIPRLSGKNILGRFEKAMGVNMKPIHTTKCPFDNIASFTTSPKYIREFPDHNERLERWIERYDLGVTRIERALSKAGTRKVFTWRNELLIEDPKKQITELAEYLDLPVYEEWLKNACNIVLKKPNFKSLKADWSPETFQFIYNNIIMKYSSLEFYQEYAKPGERYPF